MIYRIDVRTAPLSPGDAAGDPLGEAVRQQIAELGTNVGSIKTQRIFLMDSDATEAQVLRAARELLADPIVETAQVSASLPRTTESSSPATSLIEIHLKPGVMDPVAFSTQMALRDMGIAVREVRTGRAYEISARLEESELKRIAARVLANGVIESVHFERFVPEQFESGHDFPFQLRHVSLRELSDELLARLSRDGHLFLSLAEMKAIQSYYREQGREPTDIELETLAQTWSEHCVHKTLKSAVDVEVRDSNGRTVGKRHYDNLIKDTIFASTMELMGGKGSSEERNGSNHVIAEGSARPGNSIPAALSPGLEPLPPKVSAAPFCLSVFKDNAGVIVFDETDAVCFKVETHNHPSAIEPYGGSATGIGGVIRDILGTGLAARPIANTDVFCVAFPDRPTTGKDPTDQIKNLKSKNSNPTKNLPKGVIHPKRVLRQIVAGVRDYGNRMGIPTVNGAVYFDDRYLGNPLVFCGCVGLIPRDKIEKETQVGDAIVVLGGRTGRDGIHGATFSSAELTDTHADEFSHAVQIGNAITEKKVADVILQARDRELFTAVTDCGAGGLSSAVGEMGEKVGAVVELEKVPLKYAGLRYDEIWISEAQERMVLSVPAHKLGELLELAKSEDVEATVIGSFGTDERALVLSYRGQQVGQVSMDFLHHGIPMPRRKAVILQEESNVAQPPSAVPHGGSHDEVTNRGIESQPGAAVPQSVGDVRQALLATLAHPNIASKHWIIRQYDHEVQGGSVVKPLVGPLQVGPSDAAVVRPKLTSRRGVAIGCGMAPHIIDPYEMALASIDEAIRNVVAVGADPAKIAILDNFCWPSADDDITMGTLVRACEACRDAALTYRIPFISGKDSLHNQFTDSETGRVIRIPNTLLISAIGIVDDVSRCVTMDLKMPGNQVALVEPRGAGLANLPAVHLAMAKAVRAGLVVSAHDVSDGGAAVAAAEMCIASGLGLDFGVETEAELFAEHPGRYIIEYEPERRSELDELFETQGAAIQHCGIVQPAPTLRLAVGNETTAWTIPELTQAWRGTLDW